jgi:hypothetical protein
MLGFVFIHSYILHSFLIELKTGLQIKTNAFSSSGGFCGVTHGTQAFPFFHPKYMN